MIQNIFLKKITLAMLTLAAIATIFTTHNANAQAQPNNPNAPNTDNKPQRPHRSQNIDKQIDRMLNQALATPEQIAQKKVEQLNKKVELTEQQKKQLYDLWLLKAKKIEQISAQKYHNPNRDELKKELQETLLYTRKQIKTILTPEQQQKLRETRHNHPPRHQQHHRHNRRHFKPMPPPPPMPHQPVPPQAPPPAQR